MITRAQPREEERKAFVEAVVVREEPIRVVRRMFNIAESAVLNGYRCPVPGVGMRFPRADPRLVLGKYRDQT